VGSQLNSPTEPFVVQALPNVSPQLKPIPMPLTGHLPNPGYGDPHFADPPQAQPLSASTHNIWLSLESLQRARRPSIGEQMSPSLGGNTPPTRRPAVQSSRSDPPHLNIRTSPGIGPVAPYRAASVPIRYGTDQGGSLTPSPTSGPYQQSPTYGSPRDLYMYNRANPGPQGAVKTYTPTGTPVVSPRTSPLVPHGAAHPDRQPEPFLDAHGRRMSDVLPADYAHWNPAEPFVRHESIDGQTLAFPSGSSSSWSEAGGRGGSDRGTPNLSLMDPSLLPSLGIQNPPGVGTAYGTQQMSPAIRGQPYSFVRPSGGPYTLGPPSPSTLDRRRAFSANNEVDNMPKPIPPRLVYPAASAPGQGFISASGRPQRNFTTESILSGASSGTLVVHSGEIPSGSIQGDFSYLLSKMAAVGVGSGKGTTDTEMMGGGLFPISEE
jgi:hypothetical protein